MRKAAVGKRGDRPGVLFMLMLADHDSGFIFGLDPIMAENELAGICADLPNRIALMLLNAGFLPKRLMVRRQVCCLVFRPPSVPKLDPPPYPVGIDLEEASMRTSRNIAQHVSGLILATIVGC